MCRIPKSLVLVENKTEKAAGAKADEMEKTTGNLP